MHLVSTILLAILFYVVLFAVVYFASSYAWRRKIGDTVKTPIVIASRKDEKIGVMDKVLIIECIAIVLFVIADFVVFWHTGNEPSTLTVSFFAVCGGENGFMAWIKTRKDQEQIRRWQFEDSGEADKGKEENGL